MPNSNVWGGVSIGLGVTTAGLGCYGAWEFARTLEGGALSYLGIAAPVVAAAAALIPPLAEHSWKQGMRFKAVLWWLVLIPAAATVFYASAERVYIVKAGAEAERAAYRNDSLRAQAEHDDARTAELVASAEAAKASGWKTKGAKYQGILAVHEAAVARLESAKLALVSAEKKATPESALKAPSWLMPLALDLVAFIAIWSGLTGPAPQSAPVKKRRKKRKAAAPRKKLPPVAVLRRAA